MLDPKPIIIRQLFVATLLFFVCTGPGWSRELPDFTVLAEQNRAAVVNIGTTLKANGHSLAIPHQFELPDLPEDSPFNDFFRRFLDEDGMGGMVPQTSLGSGFIISQDGYVISNYHVVKGADEVMVKLSDRREFVAEVIGTDERSDLAVLKIDATGLPTVTIGNSRQLKVGEWVLAIGSPFGFDHSVTAGIVSAKERSLPNESYVPFIQTDVAINPGNSGGPLFNLDGKVVGVNSQIYSRTGGFMGLSFAIPIDVVMNVYRQLRDKGSVSRGWLGVLIQDVTRELAESFGMDKPRGALVAKVLPDSPATAAGFKAGDVVVEFNDQGIDLSSDLPPMVGRTKVGEKVPVKVIRNGDKQTLTVRIGELPEQEEISLIGEPKPGTTKLERLDVVVKDLDEEQRGELDLEGEGVVVEEVGKQGPGQKAGLRAGDVILLLDNQKVINIEQLKELLAPIQAHKSVPILVQRRGGPMFLAFKFTE